MLDDVLRYNEQRYGPVGHEVGVTLHNLGSLQYRDGDVATAETTLRRAAAIKRAAVSGTQPTLVACRGKLEQLVHGRQRPPRHRGHLDLTVAPER